MSIYEAELPGVGKKFELELPDDDRLAVVIHHSGRREVFYKQTPDADGEKLFELSDDLARKFGSILEGAYFQPVATPTIDTLLSEGTVLDWSEVEAGSSLAGRSLAEAELRARTGASILAVRRGEDTFPNPSPEFEVEAGDTLIALGSSEEIDALEALASDEDPDEA
jgi:TrkA domain protein